MASSFARSVLLLLLGACPSCAEPLPDDIENYREACVQMNCDPIPVKSDDPHEGEKDVFACNVSEEALISALDGAPYPDGTIIVKESTRTDSDYPWLVATAEKRGGRWKWDEYSRNFENEEFLHIIASESVCIDCHKKVEDSQDWIYTAYRPRDACE